MIYINEEKGKKKIILKGVSDFDPVHIFECGQCFRWNREQDNSYTGIAFQKVINLSMKDDEVILENTTEEEFEQLWRDYFDFSQDYGKIKETLCEDDSIMAEAVSHGEGVRLLRQQPWETVISFIISQNSNIPRIKNCIEALCREFGPYLGDYRGKARYGFPLPEVLAGLRQEDLAGCRLGYRDKYVLETARAISSSGTEELNQLIQADIESAEAYLRRLPGVGPKVAHCILLFGLYHQNSFPVDVWMRRVMHNLYGFDENDIAGMKSYANEKFSPFCGMAQQYLFYFARETM